jgi:hypothetical protein
MALHDFWCQVCGQVLVDVNVPISIGATAGAPEHCGRPANYIPTTRAMDIGGVKTAGFRGFTTRDGRGNRVEIDSLHKMRQVERQSEQDYRNGEGQPIVFRRWANTDSNRDVHTLHPGWTGGAAPDPAWVKKNAAALKRDMSVADTEYGPGISDATPSALDHLEP